MVLGGICGGIFIYSRKGLELFYTEVLPDINFYVICIAIAFVYTFAFKIVYKSHSNNIDLGETVKRFIGYSFVLILSTCLTAVFFGILFF